MSDDFTELEAELKQLRPRTLRSATLARLAAASPDAAAATLRPAWFVWLWPALGAAAALALVLAALPWRPARDGARETLARDGVPAGDPVAVRDHAAGLRLTPVSATNAFFGADVERTVRLADDLTARQVRLRYLDTVTWRDPQGGATYQWRVPREEVVMVPAYAD